MPWGQNSFGWPGGAGEAKHSHNFIGANRMTEAQKARNAANAASREIRALALDTDSSSEDIEKANKKRDDLELRAEALEASEPEVEPAKITEDSESRERKELRSKVKMADYIDAAGLGRDVSGAAAEYNQALEIRGDRFPLSMLAPEVEERSTEERATTDTDGRVTQGSWIDRVFAQTAAQRLGVTFASVGPGQVAYPVLTAGVTAAQRGRGEAAADAAWTVGSTAIEPTRNTVRLVYNRVDALRLPSLEEALRREARMALTEGIDRAIFSGDSGANEDVADITGLTTAVIGESTLKQAEKVKGAKVLEAFVDMVDGTYAAGLADLRIVMFVGAWKLWEKTPPKRRRGQRDDSAVPALGRAVLGAAGWHRGDYGSHEDGGHRRARARDPERGRSRCVGGCGAHQR